jgi:hypothetical protein
MVISKKVNNFKKYRKSPKSAITTTICISIIIIYNTYSNITNNSQPTSSYSAKTTAFNDKPSKINNKTSAISNKTTTAVSN